MSTNVFLNLPVPTSNSAGAAVDTSTLAASKTIIVGGAFAATVTIEYSTAPSGNLWAPVPGGSFQGAGRVTIPLAVRRMRAVTSNYVSGAPNADVGAPFAVAGFVQLSGVAADISALPAFKTVTVSGACIVEVSEDGVSYSQVFAFQQAGAQSAVITGQFARVTGGVTCWMGGAVPGIDDGSGSGSLVDQGSGRFDPNIGPGVQITAQTGQFVNPGVLNGIGQYTIHMIAIPGVASADQVIPQLTGSSGGPVIAAATVGFSVDHATIDVAVYDTTGSFVSDPFFMHVDIIGP